MNHYHKKVNKDFDENGWQHYVYPADECALHTYIIPVRASIGEV